MHDKGRARKRGVHGPQHHNARLNEDAVRAIRKSDASATHLAKQFNVSRAIIYDVRKRKIWKHVPE
jgi:hypothetical protein